MGSRQQVWSVVLGQACGCHGMRPKGVTVSKESSFSSALLQLRQPRSGLVSSGATGQKPPGHDAEYLRESCRQA